MEGLQRSTASFRRQGSSGLVWDDKVLSGDGDLKNKVGEMTRPPSSQNEGSSTTMMRRSRSDGGRPTYRTDKAPPPSADPPSPKVSGCGVCGLFGKPAPSSRNPKSKQRKS